MMCIEWWNIRLLEFQADLTPRCNEFRYSQAGCGMSKR